MAFVLYTFQLIPGYILAGEQTAKVGNNNLKYPKSANLIKILILPPMVLDTRIGVKTRKIAKKMKLVAELVRRYNLRAKIDKQRRIQMTQTESLQENPLQNSSQNHQTSSGCPGASKLTYFHSYNPYTLGSMNSIVFSQGRIYDMLLIKKSQSHLTRCPCFNSSSSIQSSHFNSNTQVRSSCCGCSNGVNSLNVLDCCARQDPQTKVKSSKRPKMNDKKKRREDPQEADYCSKFEYEDCGTIEGSSSSNY